VIARKFPADVYGEMVTVFSAANIFIMLFDLGLPVLLQKETAVLKEKSSGYLSSVILVNLIFFPLYISAMILFFNLFFSGIPLMMVSTISLMVYFFSIGNILNKSLSGLWDFKSQFSSLCISRSISLIFFLSAVYFFNSGAEDLLLILTAGALIQIAVLLNEIRKNKLNISFKLKNRPAIGPMLKLSFPLGLAVLFNFLYDKIDIILISKLTDFDQTAFYNAAYGILRASTIAFSFMFAAGLTRVSGLKQNRKAVRLFFKKYSAILFQICIIISTILFFGSDLIIRILYTGKFAESAPVLKILSFALIGLALNNLSGIILNGLGFFRKNMNVTLLGLIINVILNLIFIPMYGIAAAAIITVITEYFILSGDYFYIRKYLRESD
jgi:O-antigen/teichoic acid export membrane protein